MVLSISSMVKAQRANFPDGLDVTRWIDRQHGQCIPHMDDPEDMGGSIVQPTQVLGSPTQVRFTIRRWTLTLE